MRLLILTSYNVTCLSEDNTNEFIYSYLLLMPMLLYYSVLYMCVLYIFSSGTLWRLFTEYCLVTPKIGD